MGGFKFAFAVPMYGTRSIVYHSAGLINFYVKFNPHCVQIFNQILEVGSKNGIHPIQQGTMARKKVRKLCLQKRARQFMTCHVLVLETVISQVLQRASINYFQNNKTTKTSIHYCQEKKGKTTQIE